MRSFAIPLRDHFRPPVWNEASWEGFHGLWPGTMVLRLVPKLPRKYTAEPRLHLGRFYEIDVCATPSEKHESGATPVLAPPPPTFEVDAELGDEYAYEVRIFDQSRARLLVAAVEIVSPANKGRRRSRRAFATKCAALLQAGVCVSIVDIVTIRKFNLYAETMNLIEQSDPAFSADPPPIYAVTCRTRNVDDVGRFQSWAYPLAVGQPLPELPIWLSDDLHVTLDLEASYEDACRALRIA